jgi:proprotein convertase subtilisin/kexin type 5
VNTGYLTSNIFYSSPENQVNYNITYYTVSGTAQYGSCVMSMYVCYPSCENCTGLGTEINHYCSSCRTDYNMLGTNCYKTCPSTYLSNAYYANTASKTCTTCGDGCQTCSSGTVCSTCKTGYYLVMNATSNNCVSTCAAGYTLTNNTCVACNFKDSSGACINCVDSKKFYYNKQCVDSCPTGLYPDTSGSCIDCTDILILYNGKCYTTCPDLTIYDSDGDTCYTCEERGMRYLNNTCVAACPVGSALNSNNKCESCKTRGLYYFNYTCIDICPFGTIENTNTAECDIMVISSKFKR